MDNPCGLPTRPPTGRRLPTSSTGPQHKRRKRPSNTPRADQASQARQRPPRRPSTSPPPLIPTISTAQPSTAPKIGHVPEITGHVRRNAHSSARKSPTLRLRRGLTNRSSGPAAARHQGPVGGTLYIFAHRALASRRCGPLTYNVRHQNTPVSRRWLLLSLPPATEHRPSI